MNILQLFFLVVGVQICVILDVELSIRILLIVNMVNGRMAMADMSRLMRSFYMIRSSSAVHGSKITWKRKPTL